MNTSNILLVTFTNEKRPATNTQLEYKVDHLTFWKDEACEHMAESINDNWRDGISHLIIRVHDHSYDAKYCYVEYIKSDDFKLTHDDQEIHFIGSDVNDDSDAECEFIIGAVLEHFDNSLTNIFEPSGKEVIFL